MTYEFWNLVSRNMIDWFDDREDASQAVRAYVDAGEENEVMLLEHDDAEGVEARSLSGHDLVQWLNARGDPLRHSA